ncbi:hypothetical protein L1987_64994 [Smallanthus sonchifolius]|uniref:Uncharacterized protein n=1 Tax=Smallanthus sonchifolius TaxID=185202 RepID=A0ACB9BTC0_9ASTR|nr:hypothetical protein L1987_64994 [Smallanthus sonchifolius]
MASHIKQKEHGKDKNVWWFNGEKDDEGGSRMMADWIQPQAKEKMVFDGLLGSYTKVQEDSIIRSSRHNNFYQLLNRNNDLYKLLGRNTWRASLALGECDLQGLRMICFIDIARYIGVKTDVSFGDAKELNGTIPWEWESSGGKLARHWPIDGDVGIGESCCESVRFPFGSWLLPNSLNTFILGGVQMCNVLTDYLSKGRKWKLSKIENAEFALNRMTSGDYVSTLMEAFLRIIELLVSMTSVGDYQGLMPKVQGFWH